MKIAKVEQAVKLLIKLLNEQFQVLIQNPEIQRNTQPFSDQSFIKTQKTKYHQRNKLHQENLSRKRQLITGHF